MLTKNGRAGIKMNTHSDTDQNGCFFYLLSQIFLKVIKHGGDGLTGDGLLPAIAVLLAMSTVCAEQAPYPTLPFL